MSALDKATKAMEARCPHGPFNGTSCAFCRSLARVALEAVVEDVATMTALGCDVQSPSCDASYHRDDARRALGLDGASIGLDAARLDKAT